MNIGEDVGLSGRKLRDVYTNYDTMNRLACLEWLARMALIPLREKSSVKRIKSSKMMSSARRLTESK